MIVVSEPAPVMVTLSVISRSPVAAASACLHGRLRLYVQAGTSIVSLPGSALLAIIDSRNEQSESQAPSAVSLTFVTLKVAAAADLGKTGLNRIRATKSV